MASAYQWVKSNGGITTDAAYPYKSGSSGSAGSCKTSGYSNDPNTAPSGYANVQPTVTALQKALLQQPISIGIDASSSAFQNYASGVISTNCGQTINHGVLLVGYGTANGVKYWKVQLAVFFHILRM